MNNLYSTEQHAHSENQSKKQPPDLRFCRAWWLFKKALYPTLGNAALRVFLVLEDRASQWNDYQVPMSLSTLADETGVRHHTTLASGIRELETAGIIAVTRQGSNSRLANSYTLLIRDLIGAEQEVFSSRSNSGNDSSSDSGGECDCDGDCQIAASVGGSRRNMGNTNGNSARCNGAGSNASDRKAGKVGSKSKAIGGGRICNSRNYHAISAVAGDTPTSAENELLEMPYVSSGSANIDSVLSCINNTSSNNKNKNTWFNSNELNGVTAAKIPPVKAKFDQRQGQSQIGHDNKSLLAGEHEPASLVTCSDALNKNKGQPGSRGQLSSNGQAGHAKAGSNRGSVGVAKPKQVQAQSYRQHGNFEAKSYSGFYQPQSRNIRQLREECFKRLSWAMNARERMTVLFAALRVALGEGQELGKADFSGIQTLVNEYGCKQVLAGIVATIGKGIDRPVYFAYLRGVIRRQGQDSRNLTNTQSYQARPFHQVQPYSFASANTPFRHQQQLPIDLAKYAGTGKYAHLVNSFHKMYEL